MSEGRIKRSGFYETSYGHSNGYNSRSQSARQQHWEHTWQDQYAPVKQMQNKSIASCGYDTMSMAHLYPRSAQVRSTLQNQQGLLGPGNVDSVKRMTAGDSVDAYLRRPDVDRELAAQLQDTSTWRQPRTGDRAQLPQGHEETRSEQIVPHARWSSRHSHEKMQAYRPVNYDTEYTSNLCDANHVDRSGWMRDNTISGHSNFERDFEVPSKTKADVRNRHHSERYLSEQAIWETHPGKNGISTFEMPRNTYPDPPEHPHNFNMLDHIPQYRNARLRPGTTGSLGTRNIGPPLKSRPAKNFWPTPTPQLHVS